MFCFVFFFCSRFLRSNALKTKYKDIYRPSTGAVMLLAALHTCDQVGCSLHVYVHTRAHTCARCLIA